MKKWGKRFGIVVGILVGLVVVFLGVVYGSSVHKQGQHFDPPLADFEIPSDPASLTEGERLYVSRGCGSTDCHTDDATGHVMMDDGPLGTIAAANLTIAAEGFQARDWDRAVRHGLRSDGTSLIFMPSLDFQRMSDRELGLIVAYIRSRPLVRTPQPPCQPSFLARFVDFVGGFPLFPGTQVDHAHVPDPDPEPGRNVAYGEYLSRLCTGCHGEHLSGGPIPGAPPEMGTPLNLTPDASGLQGWTEEQFRTVLREGRRPGGQQISPTQMPYPALARMTDDEIGAIWMYLQTVPALPEGSR